VGYVGADYTDWFSYTFPELLLRVIGQAPAGSSAARFRDGLHTLVLAGWLMEAFDVSVLEAFPNLKSFRSSGPSE
jgi:hypothetical protein